jgi:O-glycosyl hydrolase
MPAVLDAIARRLKKESLGDVRLVTVEQANVTTDYISGVLQDTEVMRQIGVFSFHTYGEESVGPQVERIRGSGYPDRRVWLTEYGDLSDRDKSFENEWKQQSLKASRRALRALNQGASAALFWDAFDNFENCELRPSFYGLMRNDNHSYSPKKRYFAAKQLYHFVRPGSVRVAADADSPQLLLSAFRDGSAGTLAIVGVKDGGPNNVQIRIPESKLAPAFWDVYQTTRTLDCRKTGRVTVVDGTTDLDLPDEVIFTLLGAADKH